MRHMAFITQTLDDNFIYISKQQLIDVLNQAVTRLSLDGQNTKLEVKELLKTLLSQI